MLAIRAMLLVLAAVPSAATHLCLIQTKTELLHQGTPVQPVDAATVAEQPAMRLGNATDPRTQIGKFVVDEVGFWIYSKNSNTCVSAMIIILFVSLGIFIWTQRGRFGSISTKEKIATSFVMLYIGLTISIHVLIRKFHKQGVNTAFLFSPAVVSLLIELGKLSVMIVGACVDWKNTRKCCLADFVTTLRLMSIPAACFATMNILRYLALSGTDLDNYRVWRSIDNIFVACAWFTIFKKTPGVNQILGIGLVCLSYPIMASNNGGKTPLGEVVTLLSMALLSSLGLVVNEFGFKASTQLSIFVQCGALYFMTTVMTSAVVLATVPTGQIFNGINSPQMGLVGLDVMSGVCIACVLKYADAIFMKLASGCLVPLEPLVGHFFVGTPVTPAMVFATTLAGAGSIVYRLPERSQTGKGAASQLLAERIKKQKQSGTEQGATEQ